MKKGKILSSSRSTLEQLAYVLGEDPLDLVDREAIQARQIEKRIKYLKQRIEADKQMVGILEAQLRKMQL